MLVIDHRLVTATIPQVRGDPLALMEDFNVYQCRTHLHKLRPRSIDTL